MSTKEYFQDAYEFSGEPDGHPNTRQSFYVHFIRWSMFPIFRKFAKNLADGILDKNKKVLIVGGAFGWLTEILENEYGYENLYTLDDSPYIQENKDKSEDEEIDECIRKVGLDPNVGEGFYKKQVICDGGPRCRTKRGIITDTNEHFDIIMTERVLSSLTDSQAKHLSVRYNKQCDLLCHLVQNRVHHGTYDSKHNWKSVKGWKNLLPNDVIIGAQNWEIL
jgi:hypothetical protein